MITTVLRIIAIVSVSPVLAMTAVLLFVGGKSMVVQEVAEGAPLAPPMTMRQPVPIAVLPLAISLLTLAGLIRGHLPTIVGGGIALVIAGVMLMFSFGIWISFVGIAVLIVAVAMWRLQRQHAHSAA